MKKRKEREIEEEREEKQQEETARQAKMDAFWTDLAKSEDLNDNLQQLVDYIKEFTSVESVYVGKLVAPKKAIQDEDDDTAHQDEENADARIVQFLHASKGQEFMVD